MPDLPQNGSGLDAGPKTKNLKFNVAINTVKNVVNLIFPIITYPYASRVLLPEGIGKVQYAVSFVAYFSMFAMLGIAMYGTRECARARDSRAELTKLVHELLRILSVTTAVAYAALFAAIFLIPGLAPKRDVILVCSTTVLFTSIGVEWLYQGLEEYGYITVRSLIMKAVSIVALFALVHGPQDYLIYAGITVSASVGSNILNFINLRRYISIRPMRGLNARSHLRPLMMLFAMSAATSVYTNLDPVMIGWLTGSDAFVGFYTTANKMVSVVLVLVTTMSTVLLPRISYYIKNNLSGQLHKLILKSINVILFLALPGVLTLVIFAKPIILLMSGGSFLPSVPTMRILAPVVIFIALSNLIGIQYLLPHGRERITVVSVFIGAGVNFTLKLLFLGRFGWGYSGAALATVISEASVVGFQFMATRDVMAPAIFNKNNLKYLIACAVMAACALLSGRFIDTARVPGFALSAVLSGFLYCLVLFILKDGVFHEFSHKLIIDPVIKILKKGRT